MPSKKTKIVHNKKVKLYRNKNINSIIFLNSTKIKKQLIKSEE